MILSYCAKNIGGMDAGKLHCRCALNMGNYNIENAVIKDCTFDGGCITDTFKGKYITEVHSDGSFSYKSFSLKFVKGILQSASW